MASTAANADGRGEIEHNGNGQGMRMLELMSSTVDGRGNDNHYEIQCNDYEGPSSIAATTFAEGSLQAEEPVYANIQ